MIKVSTIIPAYNADRTIAQAVDSALSQDFDGHEVVVVNDGSTDSTAAILERYGNLIQVVTQPNGGLSAARNTGVRRSTGDYLAFLDADDIWLPGKLKTTVALLEQNPRASLAFTEFTYFDDTGQDLGGSSIGPAPSLEEIHIILPSTWVVPRSVFARTGGFREEFKGADGCGDDWILLLLHDLGEFVYFPERLTLYRVGDSGKVADKWGRFLSTYITLVKHRYGAKGRSLIRSAKDRQCRRLLSKMAYQMNNGDRLGALRTLLRIARLRSAYFFCPEFRERLLLPHNLRRVRDLLPLSIRSE